MLRFEETHVQKNVKKLRQMLWPRRHCLPPILSPLLAHCLSKLPLFQERNTVKDVFDVFSGEIVPGGRGSGGCGVDQSLFRRLQQ